MSKTKISEFSSDPALNTDIDGINIAEGCAPSGINNAIRELMSQLKDWQSGTSLDTFNTNYMIATAVDINGGTIDGTTIGGSTAAAGTFTDVTLNAQGDVRFADSDSSNWVAFQAPATIASNVTWTLPAADGTSGQVIQTNGSGILSFATPSSLSGETQSTTPFETSLGSGAGAVNTGVNNTFVGFEAGNDNTTGTNNVAVGYQALDANTTGVQNTAVGSGALGANTTGQRNTAVGMNTLRANTTGTDNTGLGTEDIEAGYAPFWSNTTGSKNVAVGNGTLGKNTTGSFNVAVGFRALGDNTTANNNVAIGYYALIANTTGADNTAVGYQALDANTTGIYNTALGSGALGANTTGQQNVAVGFNALDANTTGQYNIGIGQNALGSATTAEQNTAVGWNALATNTTGGNNTAFGGQSLYSNTTGANNTAVGQSALYANTTGTQNTAVGYGAGDSITTGVNKTVIGYNADVGTPTGSHEIVIGSGITGQGTDYFTFGSSGNLVYNQFTANATFTRSSDERLKTDINDMNVGLDFVNRLRPVSYKWKPSNEVPQELFAHYNEQNQMNLDVVMHGFIAQEVKQALEDSGAENCGVWTTERDGTQAISREMFIMPLVKAIQELSAQVTALQAEVNTLKGQ